MSFHTEYLFLHANFASAILFSFVVGLNIVLFLFNIKVYDYIV